MSEQPTWAENDRLVVNASIRKSPVWTDVTVWNVLRLDERGGLVAKCGHNHGREDLAERCMRAELRRWGRKP